MLCEREWHASISWCGGLEERRASRVQVMLTIGRGQHGSTYGGNPVAAKVALAALRVLVDERLAENSFRLGQLLRRELQAIQSPIITEVGAPTLQGLQGPHACCGRPSCCALSSQMTMFLVISCSACEPFPWPLGRGRVLLHQRCHDAVHVSLLELPGRLTAPNPACDRCAARACSMQWWFGRTARRPHGTYACACATTACWPSRRTATSSAWRRRSRSRRSSCSSARTSSGGRSYPSPQSQLGARAAAAGPVRLSLTEEWLRTCEAPKTSGAPELVISCIKSCCKACTALHCAWASPEEVLLFYHWMKYGKTATLLACAVCMIVAVLSRYRLLLQGQWRVGLNLTVTSTHSRIMYQLTSSLKVYAASK